MSDNQSLVHVNTFTSQQIDLLKRTICKGATDDEFALFVGTSQRLGLDPLARQIYQIRYGGTMTIMVSIDGLRLCAERTGNYLPGEAPRFTYDEKGRLESCTASVRKFARGQWHLIEATAFLEEYRQNNNFWNTKPRVMLSKTAESIALRKAFPLELAGVQSAEEALEVSYQEVTDAPAASKAKALDVINAVRDTFGATNVVKDADFVESPPATAPAVVQFGGEADTLFNAIQDAPSLEELEAVGAAIAAAKKSGAVKDYEVTALKKKYGEKKNNLIGLGG